MVKQSRVFDIRIVPPYTFNQYVENIKVEENKDSYVILNLPKTSIVTFGILSDVDCILKFYISYDGKTWYPYCIVNRKVTLDFVLDEAKPLQLALNANKPITYVLDFPLKAKFLKIETDTLTGKIQMEIASDAVW